jgi:malate dehydrogenase (oxaloacetate-decarboxylating)
MEGKAMLFKHFANIDAVPIVLDVHGADEIIEAVKAIAPSFGGINLEDISAPKCFKVEERLKSELKIPVMHDDQHGTAIVTLAGLINATKVVNKDLNSCRVTLSGTGAAGVAITKLIKKYAPGMRIVAVDSKGVIYNGRGNLNNSKLELIKYLDKNSASGSLKDAIVGSDIFIGVSSPNILTVEMVHLMADKPIIFAMANPDPEISPELAHTAGVAVIATGRSDYPNQVNNALAFPGIFRGALDNRINKITEKHKLEAAVAIAELVDNPTSEKIIPSLGNHKLVNIVANTIR